MTLGILCDLTSYYTRAQQKTSSVSKNVMKILKNIWFAENIGGHLNEIC